MAKVKLRATGYGVCFFAFLKKVWLKTVTPKGLYCVITDTKGNFKSNLTFAIPCTSGRNVSYLDEAIVKEATRFNGKEIIFYFTQRRIAFIGQEI